MTIPIVLPKIGFAMQEGTIAEWLVPDGGIVKEGEIIYLMESDKSTQEVEAPGNGTLRIIAQAGETHPVGSVVGELL